MVAIAGNTENLLGRLNRESLHCRRASRTGSPPLPLLQSPLALELGRAKPEPLRRRCRLEVAEGRRQSRLGRFLRRFSPHLPGGDLSSLAEIWDLAGGVLLAWVLRRSEPMGVGISSVGVSK
jgi:hypothetical protein